MNRENVWKEPSYYYWNISYNKQEILIMNRRKLDLFRSNGYSPFWKLTGLYLNIVAIRKWKPVVWFLATVSTLLRSEANCGSTPFQTRITLKGQWQWYCLHVCSFASMCNVKHQTNKSYSSASIRFLWRPPIAEDEYSRTLTSTYNVQTSAQVFTFEFQYSLLNSDFGSVYRFIITFALKQNNWMCDNTYFVAHVKMTENR